MSLEIGIIIPLRGSPISSDSFISDDFSQLSVSLCRDTEIGSAEQELKNNRLKRKRNPSSDDFNK